MDSISLPATGSSVAGWSKSMGNFVTRGLSARMLRTSLQSPQPSIGVSRLVCRHLAASVCAACTYSLAYCASASALEQAQLPRQLKEKQPASTLPNMCVRQLHVCMLQRDRLIKQRSWQLERPSFGPSSFNQL